MDLTSDKLYLVSLNHFSKFGQKSLKTIKEFFPTWKDAYFATAKALTKAGIRENIASEFVAQRQNINPEFLYNWIKNENIEIIELSDKNYSKHLKEIYDPPALLFCKGNISLLNSTCIAVVGSRKFSNYGSQTCTKLCNELSQKKFTIVSGLALGIDSIAHNTALDNNGNTIAVLGTGIDKKSIYPSSNRYLSEKIIANNGLVITEFSLETQPMPYNFPMRNRIISGLSLGTIVVEAAIKSGALITARTALEQNREVFAVPGSIFNPASEGPNHLLTQGACLCRNIEDILDGLDLKHINKYIGSKKILAGTKDEQSILDILSHEPTHIDDVKRASSMTSQAISSTITMMELKGMVKNLGGMKYVLL